MGHSRPRRKNARRKSAQEDKADAIPDELLGLVFLRLTSPLDLVCTAFTCRRWRKVIAAEDFRVLCALHGAPSSIAAGHYRVGWSGCCYRPSGRKPHFVHYPFTSWSGVAAKNLALDFLPQKANGDLSLELADARGGLILLKFGHTKGRGSLTKLSRLIVCDPLAGHCVTILLSTAFHRFAKNRLLGAALRHGEDAAARISLSNFRLTSVLFEDRIAKTYAFSSAPGGHWTSGATARLDQPLKLVHFLGGGRRFVHWWIGQNDLVLEREFGELSCRNVGYKILSGHVRVMKDYLLELPWPPTFRACLY